nr:vitamin B12 dependent-methionine synthase activation domain-containing protein [Prevotella fusca]
MITEKYQGIRPAIGYPSLPDTSVNFLLYELLDMKSIGISLTETGMMDTPCQRIGLHVRTSPKPVFRLREDR